MFGHALPLLQGLRRGDSHITLEIWLPNQIEAWEETQALGEVVSGGESLSRNWQSASSSPPTCRNSTRTSTASRI